MATHSSILTLRIPKDRGAWHTRLQSMGCKESNNTLCLSIAQHTYIQASQVLLVVKNLPAMQETLVPFLGQEFPLKKG